MRFYIIFFFLAFGFYVPSSLLFGQTGWHKIDSSPFHIYYFKEDQVYAKELPALFQAAYSELANKLGLELTSSVKVFLCPTEEIFNDLTGDFVPDWGEGVADPIQSVIILKSPGVTENYDRFHKLVRHELTHVLIGQSVRHPQAMPKWFNEGMALYFSFDEEFAGGEAISKALFSDSIIPLDEIDDVLKFQKTKARLAYEESYSFTLFLEEKFGLDGIVRLIHELDAGKTFNQAFLDAFGMDLFDAELQWYKYLEEKYRWRFLLDFETLLWILILFLFIFVVMAIRLRNRRIMKKWEEEERFAN